MNIRSALMGLCAVLLFAACEDDTDTIGIASETDIITSSVQTFTFNTRSVELGPVAANSTKCYIGRVTDPATDIDVSADFIALFHTPENYSLPESDRIIKNTDGSIFCPSIELRLYFKSYKGDGNNPMKLAVYELDKDNVVREDVTYYTNTNLFSFVNPQRLTPVAEKTFTAIDQTISEEERESSDYYACIRIPLDTSEGQRILQLMVEHPEYFADSYQFSHHVCPGYYFMLKSGNGTLITIDVCVMNVNFQYKDTNGSTLDGVARFSATPEVIQSTRFENKGIEQLMASINDGQGNPVKPYTYLTSPAGIVTEVTLPVDEIYQNHENDSISRARMVLTRINSEDTDIFSTPSSLLMIRPGKLTSFFENREVADAITTYVSDFSITSNTFTFENINRLISYLYHEKQSIMQRDGLTTEQYAAAYPDWNRVMLVPVVTAVNSSNILTSVQHDFSLCSARIVGGTKPLSMQVIYSTYKK